MSPKGKTSTILKRLAPHATLQEFVTSRQDGIDADLLRIRDVRRKKLPEHHRYRQRAHSELFVPNDEGLHGDWCRVVIRCNINGKTTDITEIEGFGDPLFIAASLISAPHALSVDSAACVSTIGTPFPHRKIWQNPLQQVRETILFNSTEERSSRRREQSRPSREPAT